MLSVSATVQALGDGNEAVERTSRECGKIIPGKNTQRKKNCNLPTHYNKLFQLSSDLAVMRNRYEELDRRRILQAEGFRTDIRLLRERLKELDRQMIKVCFQKTKKSEN